MMRLVAFLRGHCRLEITGVEPSRCLNRFLRCGVGFWDLATPDAYTLQCSVLTRDLAAAVQTARGCQCQARCLARHGFAHRYGGLVRRPMLLVSLALLLVGILVLPNFIWTLEVQGNVTVPTAQILQELDNIGVRFGTWGPGPLEPGDQKQDAPAHPGAAMAGRQLRRREGNGPCLGADGGRPGHIQAGGHKSRRRPRWGDLTGAGLQRRGPVHAGAGRAAGAAARLRLLRLGRPHPGHPRLRRNLRPDPAQDHSQAARRGHKKAARRPGQALHLAEPGKKKNKNLRKEWNFRRLL